MDVPFIAFWKRLDGGIVDGGIVKGTFAIFIYFCTIVLVLLPNTSTSTKISTLPGPPTKKTFNFWGVFFCFRFFPNF